VGDMDSVGREPITGSGGGAPAGSRSRASGQVGQTDEAP